MPDQVGNIYLTGFSGVVQADIAAFLGKTLTSAEQTLATSLILSCEMYLCQKCRRQFKPGTYFDIVNSNQSSYQLSNAPISAITDFKLDGVSVYSDYVLGTDYSFDDNRFVLINSQLQPANSSFRSLKVFYTIDKFWGEDVLLAIKMWVGNLMLNREYAGKDVKSISSSGFNLSFDSETIPGYFKSVIDTYKLYSII